MSTEFNHYRLLRDLIHYLAKPGGRTHNELAHLLSRSPNQMSAVLRVLRKGPKRVVRVCDRRPDAWSTRPVYVYELTPDGLPDRRWPKTDLDPKAHAQRMREWRAKAKAAKDKTEILVPRELRAPEHEQRARHLQDLLSPTLDSPPQHAYAAHPIPPLQHGAHDGHQSTQD